MLFEVGLLFVFHAYYGIRQTAADVRVDDNKQYFSYQDVIRAFNESAPAWLYGHNVKETESDDKIKQLKSSITQSCIYFKTDTLNTTDVKFLKHHMDGGKMNSTPLYGKFFTTPARGDDSNMVNRTKPNGVNVSDTPVEQPRISLKLVYSDYKDCAFFRPFDFSKDSTMSDHRHSSYPATHEVCILFLSDKAAREMDKKKEEMVTQRAGKALPQGLSTNLPENCRLFYPQACGQEKFTVVFNHSCPRIPDAFGC